MVPVPFLTGENETFTVHCNSSSNSVSSTNAKTSPCTDDMWILYFDGSKTQDGFGSRCFLINPRQRKHLALSYLEFECTNNTAEYEALILDLYKSISLNVAIIKVVGDLEIVVRHVCNTIHGISTRLKSYQ